MAHLKILVSDDSKFIQQIAKNISPPGNFEVVQALAGTAGIKQVVSTNPNLIMLNFLSPKFSV